MFFFFFFLLLLFFFLPINAQYPVRETLINRDDINQTPFPAASDQWLSIVIKYINFQKTNNVVNSSFSDTPYIANERGQIVMQKSPQGINP